MQEVKQILESVFNKEVKVQGNTLKVTLPKLQSEGIIKLNDLLFSHKEEIKTAEIKRSGTGLTIIVTFN